MRLFHRRRSRLAALALAAVLPLSAASALPASAGNQPPDDLAAAIPALRELIGGTPKSYDITLITGDTVHVSIAADGRPTIKTELAPRPNGRSVLVHSLVDEDNLYVLPSDASDLVAAGTLDRRLFDIRKLIADGYADGKSSSLPIIVSYGGQTVDMLSASARTAAQTSLRARADALPASEPVRTLESINGASLQVTKAKASEFWSTVLAQNTQRRRSLTPGISRVWLDGKAQVTLDESVALTGAPQAWAAGFDGTGVTVAVLDTGIDASHPDLAGKVVGSRSFIDGETVEDGHGHGTHVASTIASIGTPYKGMAPGASLLVGKVLDNSGFGPDSGIIDGMEWATANGADVVSMSLGGDPTDGTDPMSQSVNSLTATTGALFVIAAGNDGPGQTVATPGTADAALTVAAVDKSGVLAGFSSQGPRVGDYAMKPEIAAPGVGIIAAKPGGGHQSMNGTSMATPHVAGAAAILVQRHPDWTGPQLKAALIGTTKDDDHTVYQTGSGQLDIAAAVRATVVPQTAAADFGKLDYPQEGPAVTKTVTYRNLGTETVTLAFSATLSDPNGVPAPAGMLTVTPGTIEVPAAGTADVTVTLDPTLGPTGFYSGQVVATAGAATLRTPIGAYKEPKGFDLKVNVPDRADATRMHKGSVLIRRIDQEAGNWTMARPSISVHLQEGVYAVTVLTAFGIGSPDLNNAAMLTAPQVDLHQDVEITLDVNQAKPIEITTDRPTETYAATLNVWHVAEGADMGFGEVTGALPYHVKPWALPTGKATVGKYFFDHTHLIGTPLVTARVPQLGRDQVLHPKYQHYAGSVPHFDGKGTLQIVDAGEGAEADFARVDVKGKVALIDIGSKSLKSSIFTEGAEAELQRATDAGATAVLAYADHGMPGLGTFPEMPGLLTLPVLAVPTDEGQAIKAQLSRGTATLRYDGQPNIEHLYTLSYLDHGGVPDSLTYRVKDSDLATLHQRHYSETKAAHYKFWKPSWPGLLKLDGLAATYSAVTLLDMFGPLTRTEHIGPLSNDTLWFRNVPFFDADGLLYHLTSNSRGSLGTLNVFTRPTTGVEHWGRSPSTPGMPVLDERTVELAALEGTMVCAACRISGLFPTDILPLFTLTVDGNQHNGEMTSYSNGADPDKGGVEEIHLYSDGQELPQQSLLGRPGILPFYLLPDGPADYRLTQHFRNPHRLGGFRTQADSVWTFKSSKPAANELPADYDGLGLCAVSCGVEPLIFLRYDLNLQLDNRLPAGRWHAFTVTPYQQPSTVAQPRIVGFKISASYDGGTTWERLPAIRLFGKYLVLAKHPAKPGPRATVSLRTEAWDADGNRVEQILTDAYGLTMRH